ncbi:hypothetical protein [Klebsiella pneumoniae]|uniref:hypothetical protein n=1 Tax=Klebsiella pneumoniae TaxID=573 RepID=UPI001C81E590|nr:hypothetical protein [Klebsiella pneumoniae]
MTSKNVANVGSIVTDKTIDSQSLLEMVNQARKQCGEKPVRNNVFIERILKWFIEFGHLNRGDMLTSEQHRCHNEKKKFQRRV